MPDHIHPETPGHRAAITRNIQAATGLDEATLERLVRAFYQRARSDAVIGHLFNDVRDWERHIATITAFWSSVGLLTARYHGHPMPAHARLPLKPHHFARWLVLFEQTLDEICSEPGKAHLLGKAKRIARSLETGVAVANGTLPPRRASA